jgi:hypothetical protein
VYNQVMASEHVLGYLAQRFSISEENLASEALTWLLGQSAAARDALHSGARAAGVKNPGVVDVRRPGRK